MTDGGEAATTQGKTGYRIPAAVLKLWRLAFFAAAAALLVFGATVLSLRYWWLPNIEQYREDIAASISRAAGQRVEIGEIAANWEGLRPHLVLQKVRVFDQNARPALVLEHIEGTLSWWSLAVGELRLGSLLIDQPHLAIRRAADGRVFVAGIVLNQADGGSGFADWVLRQHRIVIRNATLSWQDELRQAPPLVLREANLRLENGWRRHRFGLRAIPPEALAQPLDIRGDLRGESAADFSRWRGKIYARLDRTNLAALRAWVTLPFDLQSGVGGVRVWAGVDGPKFSEITADVYLRGVRGRLAASLPELELADLSGRLGWQDLKPGHEFSAKKLRFTAGKRQEFAPVDLLARFVPDQGKKKPAHGEARADGLALEPLAALADRLPLPDEARRKLAEIAPRGILRELALSWSGDWQAPQHYSAKGKFVGLGIKSVGKLPGFSGLTGNLDANENSGSLALNARAAAVEFPGLFAQPIAFDVLTTQASWKKARDGRIEVKLANASFANSHLAGNAYGSYRTAPDGPGEIDLTGQATRADARFVAHYMPLTVGQATRDWLASSLLAGQSSDVRLRLKGNLADFPFVDSKKGIFEVAGRASGGVLEYASGWPRIENITVDLLFRGKRMEILARQGNTWGMKLAGVRTVIPDLLTFDEMLEIDGEAQGPTGDMLKFIAESPVDGWIDGFTEGMQAAGNGKFALSLRIPLRHRQDSKVAGSHQFINNRVVIAEGVPALEQVNGTLRFTESSVSLPGITGQALGGPITIGGGTQRGGVEVNVQGRLTGAGLRQAFDHPLARHVQGAADWRARITVRKKVADIEVSSSLQGLGLELPPPLSKRAADSVALRLEKKSSGSEQDTVSFSYGKLLAAELERRRDGAAMKVARGAISIGGAPAKLPEQGIWLAGTLRYFNLDDWRGLLRSHGKAEMPLAFSGVDVSFGMLDALGRRFNELDLGAREQGGNWQIGLHGKEIDGDVHWRAQEPQKITARLKSLSVPEPAPEGADADEAADEGKLPALDIVAETFSIGQKKLGRLELLAEQRGPDWKIDKLKLSSPESTLIMDGVWQDWLRQPRTQASLRLDVSDIGKLLARFGFPDSVKGGTARIEGQLAWPGGPQEFKPAALSGTMALEAHKGQFLQVDPGIGKLLGILSLQALPRRITLDFRDVFSQGFAFDDISGNMRISRGVVSSDDFRMDGPAAKVAMSGATDLAAETQNLRVRVVPALGESVSVAGALLGGPLVGITALLLQKALKDPIGQIVAYEYSISGTWDNPVVAKVNKPARPEGGNE